MENSKTGGAEVGLFIANLAIGVVREAFADVETLTVAGATVSTFVSSTASLSFFDDSEFFPSSNSLT
jgi:hypothetical protein